MNNNSTPKQLADRTEWRNEQGRLHREDGPAVEWADGTKEWWVNGLRHRTDGPACEWANGTKEWWVNGLRHRTDGPAIEWVSGTKQWYVNGQRHRTDGPAREWANGTKDWIVNGQLISINSEEYLTLLASSCLRVFAECCWLWKHLESEQREPSLQVRLEELADEVQRARLKERVK